MCTPCTWRDKNPPSLSHYSIFSTYLHSSAGKYKFGLGGVLPALFRLSGQGTFTRWIIFSGPSPRNANSWPNIRLFCPIVHLRPSLSITFER